MIILNKIDQIQNEADKEKILNYVRSNARQVLGDAAVPIFPISALKSIGVKDLEACLRTELNDKVKIRLKLENPLGIAERIFDKYSAIVRERKDILVDDEKVKAALFPRHAGHTRRRLGSRDSQRRYR